MASEHNDKKKPASDFCTRAVRLFLAPFRFLGEWTLTWLAMVKCAAASFYQKHLHKYAVRLFAQLARIRFFFVRKRRQLVRRERRVGRIFSNAALAVRTGYLSQPEGKPLARLGGALRIIGRGILSGKKVFTTILNYTAPVVAVILLANLIAYVQSLDFAVSVEYNGQNIGYVENENVFDSAKLRVQQRMTYLPTDEVEDELPSFAVAVASAEDLKSVSELTDAIIETAKEDMVQATGIYLDGELLGVVRDYAPIQSALDSMLDKYKTNQANERVEFARNVESEPGLYLATNLSDTDDLLALLTSETEGDVFYTVKSGDVPSTIAAAYDMSTDELAAMNPGILESLLVGQSVLVNKSKPFLEVKCIRTETYSEEIDYDTTYVENASLWEGMNTTVSSGIKGEMSVTAEVSYIDGVEVERTVLDSVRITEPVNAVVAKGTKPMLRDPTAYIGATDGDTGMMNPVLGGSPYISQVYGRTRYERHHNAIDIAFRGNGYGQPISAVLPGTVTYSGRQGSYGNLVIINHGNGVQTWYAHCSKLYVRTGDTVMQGETIAGAGSSGNSTGIHLHFRVIINSQEVDPETCIPGYVRDPAAK